MALRRGARSAGPENDLDEASDLARVFVNEITWYMSEHKVSRAELATSMGVSAGRVSQILSGEENLTLRTLSADFTLRPLDGNAELAGSSR
jgi:antitoxin component HigA of HigAB toxin-antitoxin module